MAGDLSDLISRVIVVGRKTLEEVAGNIKRRMSETGRPLNYPVQWDSEKQRRAYFATNGFGHGIPYQRQGKYEKGWTLSEIPMGYTLANQHPAGAIGGTPEGWQSRIHRGRWPNLLRVMAQELEGLPIKVLENLRIEFS